MIDQPKKRPPGKLVYNMGRRTMFERKEIFRLSKILVCILEEIKNRVLGSPIPSSSEVSISYLFASYIPPVNLRN
jgi:hypothetical protein